MVFITRDKKTTKRLINFQFNHFGKFLLQIVYSDYKLMSQPTKMIDTLFLPRRVHVPFAKCPLYSRAIGVQKMCNLEFSTEGTRCSKQVSCSRRSARWDEFLISLSLFLFPSFISELITRTLVNRVCSRWPQKCSRTHHLRRFELGSRFVVHWRGGIAAQSSVSYLSLSLSLSFPPSGESQCGSTLYWIMLEHECTISKTRSREVLTEQEGTPCPSSCKRSRSR